MHRVHESDFFYFLFEKIENFFDGILLIYFHFLTRSQYKEFSLMSFSFIAMLQRARLQTKRSICESTGLFVLFGHLLLLWWTKSAVSHAVCIYLYNFLNQLFLFLCRENSHI